MISVTRYFRHILMFAIMLMAAWPAAISQALNRPAFINTESATNKRHELSIQARVRYRKALEEVYWRHRIWSDSKHSPKPDLDDVMSLAQIEEKVRADLEISNVLEQQNQSVTAQMVQSEINRMASHTKRPAMLRELWAALGNDPYLIGECLARPIVERRLAVRAIQSEGPAESRLRGSSRDVFKNEILLASLTNNNFASSRIRAAGFLYNLPGISTQSTGCSDNTWTVTSPTGAPGQRIACAAVWTGSEMIVWGGYYNGKYFNDGGRYDPATDTWVATSLAGAPSPRRYHVSAWTGVELIVWGGSTPSNLFTSDGGRYNPMTDSWTPMSNIGAPVGRYAHTGLWTGNEMIVWGGSDSNQMLNTGSRYDPTSDSWRPMSTAGAPAARRFHTAIWTGVEMIIWGGDGNAVLNTGSV